MVEPIKKNTTLWVRSYNRKVAPIYGYLDSTIERVQELYEKRWWGWKLLDEEIVPNHVIIEQGCFGEQHSWSSKFTKYGKFGRDGFIIRGSKKTK